MWWSLLVWCCVVAARAEPAPVTVLQMRLTYNEVHVLQLNATIEYILELTQPEGEAGVGPIPSTVWVQVEGGDGSHPVLVTARQRTVFSPGGVLRVLGRSEQRAPHPVVGGGRLRYHLRPTVPMSNSSVSAGGVCGGAPYDHAAIEQCAAPGILRFQRADFPRGFYVVSLVRDTDQPCGGGVNDDGSDWLFEEVFKGRRVVTRGEQRRKDLTIAVEPALSRTQYLVASVSTLGLFLSFYVLFGALVAAQRWAPFARVVSPRAVLASSPDTSVFTLTAVERAEGQSEGAGREPRRRLSDATFDSSDASDSDEEEINDSVTTNTVPGSGTEPRSGPGPDVRTQGEQGANAGTVTDGPQPAPAVTAEEQGPFGLPARLHLAALARRGGRTLRARSDRYLSMLSTVAVFYALPVIQFIAAFQIILNVSGSLDICYYNFLCAHRAGALSDFNHVFSNLGYLLLGALFMVQVRRRRLRRKRRPRHQEYGIPAHYGLLSALGAGMMVVGVLSASYHVCPNGLNFQFDTAFMYVLAVLMMVKIYQSRHPDVNARAHATFGVLAVLIALVVWGVLGGGPIFYGLFTVIHVFTFLLLSLRIYYVGQFRLEKQSLAAATSELRRPRYVTRLVLLLIANALNWLLAIYGLLQHKRDFAGHMLQILLGNALVHMCCYLGMKLAHGERLRWYAWVLLAGAAAAWVPALYFFLSGSTDWSSSPALSRHRNHECSVLQFYDSHDLWHMLSAMALYLTFSVLLTWDDGLSAVKRTDIPVF
ncbi:SID1 transmembrane family member 2-like isoform X3 [Danaus plexippus]|uniref:SID1 transmembrane family member 2-like isoform X3 n=1 Tax=Danaus plexippus TaxID=13037 RepID=UPI002AAF5AEF|nr:SID1 transmembrane family member 2-like isoform X3 [Danaus plexippus]